METILKTSSNYYNPNFFNGKKIENVYIFNNNGILFESCTRWFGFGSNNDYKETILDFEVKNKRKIDFNFKGSFFVKDSLYINTRDCVGCTYEFDVVGCSDKYQTTTQKAINVKFQGIRKDTNEAVNKIASFKSFHITVKTDLQKKLELFCNENNLDIKTAKEVLNMNESYKELIKKF